MTAEKSWRLIVLCKRYECVKKNPIKTIFQAGSNDPIMDTSVLEKEWQPI